VEKIPRIIRANLIGLVLTLALAGIIRTEPPYSRMALGISFLTLCYVMILLRYIMFQLEIQLARMQTEVNRVAIIGVDSVAYRLRQSMEHDPRFRARVVAFFPVGDAPRDPSIPPALLRDGLEGLDAMVAENEVDQVVVTETNLTHDQMIDIIGLCERFLVDFHLVPDLFRLLTSSVEVRNINGIPVLGVGRWPLDYLWNRIAKRTEDLVGASLGLLIAAPIIAAAAVLIRRESPGPVLYRQERCGVRGNPFTMYKLRSMRADAEPATTPAWTTADDHRRTRIGAFLRERNLDELPQLWNVLKGEMSLVGPRPERPFFVDQFRQELGSYMWRHIYKPGMTGWAQVNGLRGDTSIRDRIKHDLFYLENWSLTLDFKILLRTLFSRENAY
jgi:Undecaprenyl-phosphate glucose phosphotransferase